jgi:hypothetical protein
MVTAAIATTTRRHLLLRRSGKIRRKGKKSRSDAPTADRGCMGDVGDSFAERVHPLSERQSVNCERCVTRHLRRLGYLRNRRGCLRITWFIRRPARYRYASASHQSAVSGHLHQRLRQSARLLDHYRTELVRRTQHQRPVRNREHVTPCD